MIYQPTPHGSNRLFLNRSEMPVDSTAFTMMSVTLGALCIWGNYDSSTDEYLSWEFDSKIDEALVKQVLYRLNCKLEQKV